jgi:tetratricopeptide (TPR) repeat protein
MMSHIRSVRLRIVFLIIVLAFLLSASPLAPARSDEPHWIRITSSHFTMLTDGDLQKGRDALVRFEQMRGVFAQLLMRTRVNMPEPIDIIALRSDDEYDKASPLRQGQAGAGPAFFISGDDRDYFVLNLAQPDAWRALSREFASVLLNYNYPPTQPWFDVGFVDYFSSLRVDNTAAQIGGDPESFIGLLNTAEWLSIPALFNTQTVSDLPGARHDLFRAQSWIVMHYLLNQNKLSDTGRYFDLALNQKLPVEEAIQKAYGVSAAQVAQAVKDYFHSLAAPPPPPQKGKTPAGPPGSQSLSVTTADQIGSNFQDVANDEGQALLEEMRVRLPERREAAMAALESFAKQPKADNVIVHRALAWTYIEKKDFDRAAEELTKGAELNVKDPWLHYYSALLKRRLADSTAAAVQGLPNMMQDLRLMLDWAPEFAEAHAMLAMAQLEGGGTNAAMDSMRAALQVAPRNQSYVLGMAQIYLAGKHWDAATALLERLKNSSDPRIAKSASEQLEGLPTLKKYGIPPPRTPDAGSPTASASTSASLTPPALSSSRSSATKPSVSQAPAAKTNPLPDQDATAAAGQPPAAPQPDRRPIQHVKGKLLSVDCAQAPAAVITMSAGTRLLKLRTEDYKSLTLIGADEFSCAWTTRNASVNYRAGGKADGDLASIELQ